MRIESWNATQSIRLKCPAKVNLFLDLLGKRPDGYHEISTVLCPINLWDEITIKNRRDGVIELKLLLPQDADPSDPAWQIPTDSTNLVVKAAERVRDALGRLEGKSGGNSFGQFGCTIELRKQIPAAAGLGGGSSNAAAVVIGCMQLWSTWNRTLADQVCQQLGSDVNFFLGNAERFGLMLASGRGEKTKLIPYQPALKMWLIHPPEGCSTRDVYAKVTQVGSLSKTEEFLATCQTGQESKIGAAMFNALQLPATQINGWINEQLELLAECGCPHRLMSGSGSSCFAITPMEGSFEQLKAQANQIGVNRVYEVDAWYGQSIERQLTGFADESCS